MDGHVIHVPALIDVEPAPMEDMQRLSQWDGESFVETSILPSEQQGLLTHGQPIHIGARISSRGNKSRRTVFALPGRETWGEFAND